ncbi:unnamed protein product [Symbiodinium natans]|uniref:Uncharacterized protein n=1 Tax=Symbiodinium natans TaxID=878477 RepID=A0A812U9T0_9DINO|nr:unnamed protein product [Symbiodinium natans]
MPTSMMPAHLCYQSIQFAKHPDPNRRAIMIAIMIGSMQVGNRMLPAHPCAVSMQPEPLQNSEPSSLITTFAGDLVWRFQLACELWAGRLRRNNASYRLD